MLAKLIHALTHIHVHSYTCTHTHTCNAHITTPCLHAQRTHTHTTYHSPYEDATSSLTIKKIDKKKRVSSVAWQRTLKYPWYYPVCTSSPNDIVHTHTHALVPFPVLPHLLHVSQEKERGVTQEVYHTARERETH